MNSVETPIVIMSHSAAETSELGRKLGLMLRRGDVVALMGPLGCGKTVFVQGLAVGLDVPAEQYVTSPTFTILNIYKGRIPLFHFDTYRLKAGIELIGMGYEEYFDSE
ncbi:tRNA (adenosine(37)-N6)-threonylcarbamoyltransferase complex ATPase subunit type 1 TsaE, partial [Candidatus Hydrogenedentota bacterium]